VERYRFLEHTADAKFQAFGNTLEEAFCNAALATASLIWDWEKVEKKIEFKVTIEGKDLKQLLNSFLEEIIYLWDTKMFLFCFAENLRIEKKGSRYNLSTLFKGDKYSEKYKIYGEAKAITYAEMEIKNKGDFLVQVVVDI